MLDLLKCLTIITCYRIDHHRITVVSIFDQSTTCSFKFFKVSSRCQAILNFELKSTSFHSLCSVKKERKRFARPICNFHATKRAAFPNKQRAMNRNQRSRWKSLDLRYSCVTYVYDLSELFLLSKFELACYKSKQFHSNALCTLPLRHFYTPQCFILAVWKSRLAPTNWQTFSFVREYKYSYDIQIHESWIKSTKEVTARCFKLWISFHEILNKYYARIIFN